MTTWAHVISLRRLWSSTICEMFLPTSRVADFPFIRREAHAALVALCAARGSPPLRAGASPRALMCDLGNSLAPSPPPPRSPSIAAALAIDKPLHYQLEALMGRTRNCLTTAPLVYMEECIHAKSILSLSITLPSYQLLPPLQSP